MNENNTPPPGQLSFDALLQVYSFFANLPDEIRRTPNNQKNLAKLETIITNVIDTFQVSRTTFHGH